MAESPIEKLKRLAREKKEQAAKIEVAKTQPVIGTPEFIETVTENTEANLEARFAMALEKIKAPTEQEMRLAVLRMKLSAEFKNIEGKTNEPASTALETIQVKDGEIGTGVVVQEGSSGELSADVIADEKETIQLEDASLNITTGELTPTPSNHPLAMEFAELEAMLLSADPEFKSQLRNVHRHLGKEPELVTMMTETEIQLIVRGLVELANSEIVEPAKTKAVKKATNDMKKKVISADDL